MFPNPSEKVRVVAGMAGTPPVGLPGLVEVLLAVLADRLQQPVAGLETAPGSMPSPLQTASTASRVQPPANTASRPSRACSGSVSRSKDQSMVARSVW